MQFGDTIYVITSFVFFCCRHDLIDLYSISYAWYGMISTGVCVVVGLAVSGVTHCIYYSKT